MVTIDEFKKFINDFHNHPSYNEKHFRLGQEFYNTFYEKIGKPDPELFFEQDRVRCVLLIHERYLTYN